MMCRYAGHVNSEYRIESVISSSDRHILSGSEDACVYIWHLVDVSCLLITSTKAVVSASFCLFVC